MEKTPAACSMEWSIDLEKGLRSKKPGKSVESILQFGPRLEWLNRETPPKMAETKMFGLLPGEDRLFANAILLRLAEAFRSGDKNVKRAVVKIFLSEMKQRKKRRQQCNGILSKRKFANPSELVRRIKEAFDSGDTEDRALALLIFGCWADFVQDRADIRYRIHSSLVSGEVLVVKASLFASGCLCEFSDDFGYVLLEMLVNVVTSPEASMEIRLAGARAFSKMGCSLSLANIAYETGLNLFLNSSDEDLSVSMLISVSKIASKSTLLIAKQIELLFSIFSPERTLRLQATSLRCLSYVLARGVYFLATADSIKGLFVIINSSKYPSPLQCEALRISHQLLLKYIAANSSLDKIEFFKLLATIENVIQSPILLERQLATSILADISSKLGSSAKMTEDEVCYTAASKVILFMVDRVTSLLNQTVDLDQPDLKLESEVCSILEHLLNLVQECPIFSAPLLDKLCLFIKGLVDIFDKIVGKVSSEMTGHEILEFGQGKRTFITSKLVLYVSKIMIMCLKNVKVESGNVQTLDSLKLFVEYVVPCTLFSPYIRIMHFCLLHSWVIHFHIYNGMEPNNDLDRNCSSSFHDSFIQHAISTLGAVKIMLVRKDNWSSYRAGKFAACQGTWVIAAFIFDQLVSRVRSDLCRSWLKFLAQFAYSELILQLLLQSERDSSLVNWFKTKRFSVVPSCFLMGDISEGALQETNLSRSIENLVTACKILHSSKETLRLSATGLTFGFQKWFLAVRVRILENVIEILKLFPPDELSSRKAFPLADHLSKISSQLRRLALELDLIGTSFMSIDCKSVTSILLLALCCSLLAFITGFAVFAPIQHELERVKVCSSDCFEENLYPLLAHDLMMRLQHIDSETSNKLWMSLNACGHPKGHVYLQSKTQLKTISCDATSVPALCRYAVTRVVSLQNKMRKMHDEQRMCNLTNDRMQLLPDVTAKCLNIPLQAPPELFRFRLCVSSELFAMNGEDKILVFTGFQLSLNLCLQLRDMPPDLLVRVSKLYCVLHSRASDQIPNAGENIEQTHLGCAEWGSDGMVDLNEKLSCYVRGSIMTNNGINRAGDGKVLDAFIQFELNERGQGFSSCLLDVSAFPPGSYRIKWHSGCIDRNGTYWSILPLNLGPVFTVSGYA